MIVNKLDFSKACSMCYENCDKKAKRPSLNCIEIKNLNDGTIALRSLNAVTTAEVIIGAEDIPTNLDRISIELNALMPILKILKADKYNFLIKIIFEDKNIVINDNYKINYSSYEFVNFDSITKTLYNKPDRINHAFKIEALESLIKTAKAAGSSVIEFQFDENKPALYKLDSDNFTGIVSLARR